MSHIATLFSRRHEETKQLVVSLRREPHRSGDSELLRLLRGCGFFLSGSFLFRDRDVVVGTPVVEHIIEGLHGVDLLPSHREVAGLAHLCKQFVQLLSRVAVHMHSVDENAVLEELQT